MNENRTIEYDVKYKYDRSVRSFEEASGDLLNIIFSAINLTSLKRYQEIGMRANDGKYGVMEMKFTTYGRKINIKEIPYNKLDYDYKIYIDELDIHENKEYYYTINKDKYGVEQRESVEDRISCCPHCSHYLFKAIILDYSNESWAICSNCHDIITVYR